MDSDKIVMEYVQDSITVRDHICQVFSENRTDPNEVLISLAEVIGSTIGKQLVECKTMSLTAIDPVFLVEARRH